MRDIEYMMKVVAELRAGDFLSCIGKGKLSKGIQAFTKSIVSHSAYVIEIWGELYVIDSQRDGTNPRKLEDWLNKYGYSIIVHRRNRMTKDELKEQHKRAMSKSGLTPYDFKSLLWYQPRYLITGKWKGKKNENADSRFYCSEFTGWLALMPNYWKLSPKAVHDNFVKDTEYNTFEIK